jgi:hypothetical protein
MDRRAVLDTMDRLDTATAVASGLAVHAMVNSGGVVTFGPEVVTRLLKAAMGD